MNNQLAERNLNQSNKIIIVMISIAIIIMSIAWFMPINDPYTKQVLSSAGNSTRGEAIFRVNCASCHGINARGNVGPSLLAISKHKSEVQIIKQVISGNTPPMPKFKANSQDMADLLAYLKQLS